MEVKEKKSVQVLYRAATIFDVAPISLMYLDMCIEVRPNEPAPSHDNIREYGFYIMDSLRDKTKATIVSTHSNTIAGFIHGSIEHREYQEPNDYLFVAHLYVSKLHRNKGIGLNLINAIEKIANEVGIYSYEMTAFHKNTETRWQRLGYVPYSVTYRKEGV